MTPGNSRISLGIGRLCRWAEVVDDLGIRGHGGRGRYGQLSESGMDHAYPNPGDTLRDRLAW